MTKNLNSAMVCPGCRYHSNDFMDLECPRCGLDLDEPVKRRAEKRPRRLRKIPQTPRQMKRSRRNGWDDIEMF